MTLGVPVSNIDYNKAQNLPLTVDQRLDRDAWLWLNAWFWPTQFLQVWVPFWIDAFAVFTGQMVEDEVLPELDATGKILGSKGIHTYNH